MIASESGMLSAHDDCASVSPEFGMVRNPKCDAARLGSAFAFMRFGGLRCAIPTDACRPSLRMRKDHLSRSRGVENWKRRIAIASGAIAAVLLASLVPIQPLYQPMIAVLLFVVFARALKVGSFTATLVFALLLGITPILGFSLVAVASSDLHLHQILYWSIVSYSESSVSVALFLLPIAISLATYLGRRWLYS
ncbi:MAG: hypothetical protein IPL03_02375 [Sterolibacteriaceae bacterium]|nr:hypothetical protein [Candidatus Methylophosphatis haderslevensis]